MSDLYDLYAIANPGQPCDTDRAMAWACSQIEELQIQRFEMMTAHQRVTESARREMEAALCANAQGQPINTFDLARALRGLGGHFTTAATLTSHYEAGPSRDASR